MIREKQDDQNAYEQVIGLLLMLQRYCQFNMYNWLWYLYDEEDTEQSEAAQVGGGTIFEKTDQSFCW